MTGPLWSRRGIVRAGAATALGALAAPAIGAVPRRLKIGYVSPRTGPLAAFGEADDYILNSIADIVRDGLRIGSGTYPIDIVMEDSQSDIRRAQTVARSLIETEKADIILVAGTPDTVNPVASACEAAKLPCLSTAAPWQTIFIGRQANPDPATWKPFDTTFHVFPGLDDVTAVFASMWRQVGARKLVAALYPDDSDGRAWGSASLGFPPALGRLGYRLIDPGRYRDGSPDFTSQLVAFRDGGAEILTGVVLPADFVNFWTQANQKGFRPKVATIGKAVLFPSAVEGLGSAGQNLSCDVWWTPSHPFRSSLTHATAAALAADYTGTTGQPWTQPLGFAHALFEIVIDSLKRSEDPTDRKANVASLARTNLATVVGPVKFGSDQLPAYARRNVARTPLVGGQWRRGKDGQYALLVVDNSHAPEIPLGGTMQAIGS